MSNYQAAKDKARNEAIDWQASCGEHDYSYGEFAECQEHFEKLGRRYGLLTEFKENGII